MRRLCRFRMADQFRGEPICLPLICRFSIATLAQADWPFVVPSCTVRAGCCAALLLLADGADRGDGSSPGHYIVQMHAALPHRCWMTVSWCVEGKPPPKLAADGVQLPWCHVDLFSADGFAPAIGSGKRLLSPSPASPSSPVSTG
ncbi:MAG: hypothetical protein IPM27_12075 [Nitrosomonadales bacterium]|nr:hypothetical protein [Nitrosomonadales bacterium]